jgi:arylsulfatase
MSKYRSSSPAVQVPQSKSRSPPLRSPLFARSAVRRSRNLQSAGCEVLRGSHTNVCTGWQVCKGTGGSFQQPNDPCLTDRPIATCGGSTIRVRMISKRKSSNPRDSYVHCPLRTAVVGVLVALTARGAEAQRASNRDTQQRRPNIVLMFPDNLGWGEVGVYGSVRGVPTPRIDRLAAEGMRLNNFNVEYSCTVSRAALLTGRYAVRTGAAQNWGITQWEITIAEALKPLGYATALFGKWHIGGTNWQNGRAPTDQGFDEWYGIPMTSNEAQTTTSPTFNPATTEAPYIWEGKAGEPSRKVKVFDLDTRRTVDREAAERGIAFMERSVRQNRPFFLYYPITQIHFPTLAHPDFAGKTGAGDIGDAMAELDHNVGLILDAIRRLGIERNTMVFWCTDNGAEMRRPWRGSSGPWNGFYNTVMEGGIRTPCIIRWIGRIPAGQVSNEIVHQVDFFPTIAAAVGAEIPKDRAIDGVNQLPFLEGKQKRSNRESVIYFTGNNQLRAVKWKDWKLHYTFQPEPGVSVPPLMRLFNLRSDPKEESDVKDANPWAQSVMDKIVADFTASTQQYPNVPANAPDPYVPVRGN